MPFNPFQRFPGRKPILPTVPRRPLIPQRVKVRRNGENLADWEAYEREDEIWRQRLNQMLAEIGAAIVTTDTVVTPEGGDGGSTDPLPPGSGGTGVVVLSDILGTVNQVNVADGANTVIGGDVTLSLPQDIHTGANVTFNSLSLTTPLGLTSGGTNKSLTALAGAVVWSDADSLELTAVGGVGELLVSQGAGSPIWQAPSVAIAHNLLSVYHPDTLVDTVLRGDLLVGNGTPLWSRLGIGAINTVLRTDGVDPIWGKVDLSTDVTGDLPLTGLPQAIAYSVLGNPTGATADVVNIGSASPFNVLRRSGTTLGFGPIDLSQSGAVGGILNMVNGGTNAALVGVWGGIVYSTATNLSISAAGTVGQILVSAGADTPIWQDPSVATAHALLSATHTDTVASAVSRGSLIYGNATPAWAELAVGIVDQILKTDGTDVAWGALNLSSANAVTGVLGALYGGTGLAGTVQGTLIYGSAINTYSLLIKDTNDTRYLSNTGTSNNPAWAQINLTNGVTGTLPVANGGTGVTDLSDVVGTTNQVSVSGGTDRVIGGNVTLSLPQDIHTGATPTFVRASFTGLASDSVEGPVIHDGGTIFALDQLPIAYGGTGVSDLSDILGTTNQVNVSGGTNRVIGGDVTLSLPQNIDTSASVLFEQVRIAGMLATGSDPIDLTGDEASLDVGGMTFIRITSDATRTVFGMTGGDFDGQHLLFTNVGSFNVIFANESGSAGAVEQRIITGTGADITLAPGESMNLIYDQFSGTPRWRALAKVYLATGGVGPHNLLSATHTDTAASAVSRGSLIVGNSTPAWSELVIGAANRVLRSDGTDASWAQVALATDVSGDLPFANLTQIAGLSVLGVTGNVLADVAAITAATDNQVLRRSGTALAFGAVNLASSDAVTGDLPYANLAQGSALSVLGVTGNATADNASIVAASDHQVFRRSGTAVAFGAVNLAQGAAVTGALAATNGGTGQSSYAVGDILYASTTTALSKLADVATGNALISGGVGVAPSWGKIGLTTHISGTLPQANGGTNATAFGANRIIFQNSGNTAFSSDANLTWDGSTFVMAAGKAAFARATATAVVHLAAGTTAASTAPLKFTTGTSMSSAEAGAMEFTTDDLFFTISTGPARKKLVIADPIGGLGLGGRVPFSTTNGRLTDSANLTYADPILTCQRSSIGTTPADALWLVNNTAAAAGSQQYSPSLRLSGQGWKTDATAASQFVSWRMQVKPVQGAANPSGDLMFDFDVNSGGFTNKVTFMDGVGVLCQGARFAARAGSTTDGDIWNDSTQKALQTYAGGVEQTLSGTLFVGTADSAFVENTAAETTCTPTGVGTLALPANFLVAGKVLRFTIGGLYVNTGTPTLTIRVKKGSDIIASKGLGVTNSYTYIREVIEVVVTSSTTTKARTVAIIYADGSSSNLMQRIETDGTISTSAESLSITAQWSAADPDNVFWVDQFIVEVLN